MTTDEMTPYERKARREIDAWKTERKGVLAKLTAPISRTFDWTYQHAPESVRKAVESAVLGFVQVLNDASEWTYSKKDLQREAKKVGIRVMDYTHLRDYELKKLDKIARSYFTSNKLIGALEGGALGLGGLALIAADIPALFTVAFRTIRQIGASYGFDLNDPKMKPVVLSIMGAASSPSAAAKAAALVDMRVAAVAFSKNWTYKKVAEVTATGATAAALKATASKLPRDIAKNITKRKLAQAIPFAGAVVGLGFNYWFLDKTATAAYMMFRDLYLTEKYGVPGGTEKVAGHDGEAVQCSGTTKKGKRCMRLTRDPSGRCPSHQNQ